MADAWGGSWGVSWGQSWQAGVEVVQNTDVIVIAVDAYDRTVMVSAADRTIGVDAYDRTVLIPDVRGDM